MHTLTPAAVAANRKARLSAPVERKPRVYTTTTGDAPRGPSHREIRACERALTALWDFLKAHPVEDRGCCFNCEFEHTYGAHEQALLENLHRAVEAFPGDTRTQALRRLGN